MNFLAFLKQLASHDVEFVIVGGVAARLHGSTRLTHDVDIVTSLERESWARTVDLIWAAGGRPRVPEPLERVRDASMVRKWMAEKNMLAMSFRSPDGQMEVDLVLSEVDRLDELRARSLSVTLDGLNYNVASIDDLIRMKTDAGRPQDLLDIAELQKIQTQLAK